MKEIPLTQGKVALVDDEDYERLVAMGKWHISNNAAVLPKSKKKGRTKRLLMHRVVLNINQNQFVVDHKDGNRLNNQKSNLRKCTQAQNGMNRCLHSNNTSGYKGVVWEKHRLKWSARIKSGAIHVRLGLFDCPRAAARAYNEAAIKYHGEFAKLNPL